MKITQIFCDRCGSEIVFCGDERVHDLICDRFPDHDICPDCFNQIELAGIIAQEATLRGIPEAQVSWEYYQRYNDG